MHGFTLVYIYIYISESGGNEFTLDRPADGKCSARGVKGDQQSSAMGLGERNFVLLLLMLLLLLLLLGPFPAPTSGHDSRALSSWL